MNSGMIISIGICAYNEEDNIEHAIRSIYNQNTYGFSISEVIVVSSGSTDKTDKIVSDLISEFDTLILLPQATREGKNSAINYFLDNKTAPISVLLNADNVLGHANSLKELISPFEDPSVGIVGGRPVPTNKKNSLAGFASNMLWMMHHHISTAYPKIGELIAFRDSGIRLPVDSQSDEDILRMRLEEAGYHAAYVSDAKVCNRGPETVSDFIKQRTRVNIGERYMKKNYDYDIPTWDTKLLMYAFRETVREMGFHPFKILFTASLEIYSRLFSSLHVRLNRGDANIWNPVSTTKKL